MSIIVDEHGRLVIASLDQATEDEIASWATDRLQGRDLTVSGGSAADEARHVLLITAFRKASTSAKEKLRNVVERLLEQLAAKELITWTSEAKNGLLFLAEPLLKESRNEQHVIRLLSSITTTETDPAINRRALQALVGFGFRFPPQFWLDRYKNDGQAPVVLEGLAQFDLDIAFDFVGTHSASVTVRNAFEILLPVWVRQRSVQEVREALDRALTRMPPSGRAWLHQVAKRKGLGLEASPRDLRLFLNPDDSRKALGVIERSMPAKKRKRVLNRKPVAV
jgi:hypothetical protein